MATARSADCKHVLIDPATHLRLTLQASLRGRKVHQLADELMSKALDDLEGEPLRVPGQLYLCAGREYKHRLAELQAALPSIVPQKGQVVIENSGR